MDDVVKIYLDTMVEMDRWLLETVVPAEDSSSVAVSSTGVSSTAAPAVATASTQQQPASSTAAPAAATASTQQQPASSTTAPRTNADEHPYPVVWAYPVEDPPAPVARQRKKRAREPKKRKKASYNFCKSNSLGILTVAEAHRFHGPAVLHWEGGWAGERKIQPIKPHLSIKRANADWRKLVLQNLWNHDTICALIQKLDKDHAAKEQHREMEGQLRIYANRAAVIQAINSCKPMSGVLAKDGSIWIAYRPTTAEYDTDQGKTTSHNWSRSALQLLQLQFDDASGSLLSHCCWFAPIALAEPANKLTLGSPQELKLHVNQYLLLLPKLGADDEYENKFYVVGSNWTERVEDGTFEQPQLQQELFKDWQANDTGNSR
jgi:hypothetical protein